MTVCSGIGCDRKAVARGFCSMHWRRWRKHGDANYQRPSFWDRVEKKGHKGCWIWIGPRRGKNGKQYGCVGFRGRVENAHRVSWIMINGEIPNLPGTDYRGTCVLHKCDQPLCVNPKHLFLGTHLDNMRDKVAKQRDTPKHKKFCVNGHARTPENIWFDKRRGLKHCRVCAKDRERRKRLLALKEGFVGNKCRSCGNSKSLYAKQCVKCEGRLSC